MTQTKFLITGATGDRGGYTVRQLLEKNHAVRMLAHRPDERSEQLLELGAEVVFGDLLDFDSLRAAQERAERAHAEGTLREQANLLDLTHDAIFVHNMNGVITYWNRGAEALYGWTADEARGKAAPELLKTAFPVPFELKDGRWQGELVRTTKDGTQVVVASRWSLQRDDKAKPVAILETAATLS